MKGHGTKFGPKKEKAIAALLSQRNVDEAARTVGVSPATLRRWQKLPEFKAAFLEACRAANSQSTARLQQGTSAAASTLLKIMLDPNAPAATRVRAAAYVLEYAAKAIELEDIEVRVTELERAEREAKFGPTRQER
jgi:hypothetical protein